MAATINSSNNGSNKPRKILIVDDEPDITSSFDMILQMNGFKVDTYNDPLSALSNFKRAFEILETSPDNREKLQAMDLFKDTHLVKLELLSNATTIDSALHYIRNNQQEQQQKKGHSFDSTSDQLTRTGRQTVF